jgi:hypothetical protein
MMRSNSVAASHALIRALSERKEFYSDEDITKFIEFASDGDRSVARIVEEGIDIIVKHNGMNIGELSDNSVRNYIDLLARFAVEKASRGKLLDPDVGRTLLFQLRQVGGSA